MLILKPTLNNVARHAWANSTSRLLRACGFHAGTPGQASTRSPQLALFAGNAAGLGDTDGTGAAARFNSPHACATDAHGNVYVADSLNHTIRKIDTHGAVRTWAGAPGLFGSVDGAGAIARFNSPRGIAVDAFGNVFVADTFNHTIRKIDTHGVVSTWAGAPGLSGTHDGPDNTARFKRPRGIAIGPLGTVFVADTGNHTIRMIDATATVRTAAGTPGKSGSADGQACAASFYSPHGVAVDAIGRVYVADTNNHTIRKINNLGMVSTLAGSAGQHGGTHAQGRAARFCNPHGVALDPAGNVYVADTDNHTIRKIDASGAVSICAGTLGVFGSADGGSTTPCFYKPHGVAVNASGEVLVADTCNHMVRTITLGGFVRTLAGNAGRVGGANGMGALASFDGPQGIAHDPSGNLLVSDTSNHTIRKINAEMQVSTLAGTAGTQGSLDRSGAASRFQTPHGITSDAQGNMLVADTNNHTIRKISPQGEVSTLAGIAGRGGCTDGPADFARFSSPRGVVADAFGNVFVADTNNHTIRKITASGMVSTLAGKAANCGSADAAVGSEARFFFPTGITADAVGNLYVADMNNHTIRKITPQGAVSTLAGAAQVPGGIDATGAAARFNNPTGVVVDAQGNVYVADTGNHTVRKISPDGVVRTVVGTLGQSGFVAGPLPGVLAHPSAITLRASALYIVVNNGVVQVTPVP